MTFYAEEIEVCPGYGWQGGPTAPDVVIKQLKNGHEKRNRGGSLFKHRYILPFQNVKQADYLAFIKSAFMAMGGPADSFLAFDWWDSEVADEVFGVAPSGTTPVQLSRTYPFGSGSASYTRPITKPIAGAVIKQGGVVKAGTYSQLTGLFTPSTSWTPGAILTWTGGFRVPVRFETFALEPSIDSRFGANGHFAMNGSCTLV